MDARYGVGVCRSDSLSHSRSASQNSKRFSGQNPFQYLNCILTVLKLSARKICNIIIT